MKFNVKAGDISENILKKAVSLVKEYKNHRRFVQMNKKWKKGLNVAQKITKALETIGLSPSQILEINSALI